MHARPYTYMCIQTSTYTQTHTHTHTHTLTLTLTQTHTHTHIHIHTHTRGQGRTKHREECNCQVCEELLYRMPTSTHASYSCHMRYAMLCSLTTHVGLS